tara:strand:- start:435 stop:869 length:435 start_codon:yes stop_codon:yes gene_type:complete
MTFKLKRNRKSNKKSKLSKRLKELRAKKTLTPKEEVEMVRILMMLKKKRTNKIESKKLNNSKQDEVIKVDLPDPHATEEAVIEEETSEDKKETAKKAEPVTISINININDNNNTSTKDVNWSTPDHFESAAGQYRKARIDNRKN